jgi:hypothetical protein
VPRSVVYWRQNTKPLWWSLCITVSSLFFFTRVCEHLALLIDGDRRRFSYFTTIAVVSMLLLYRCLMLTGILTQHLVTYEEIILNLILESYCYLYINAEMSMFWPQTIFNVFVPQTRSHGAAAKHIRKPLHRPSHIHIRDACFSQVYEIHACAYRSARPYFISIKFFFLCVDTVTLACIFELGLRIAAHSAKEYASTATGMLIIIVFSGAFLHTVITYYKHNTV